MKSNIKLYDFTESMERIDDIINSTCCEKNPIPLRDSLNSQIGCYVNVSAIFVDIRDSLSLVDQYSVEILAKLYKSFVSEVVAIMNGDVYCQDISIQSNSICGVFETSSDDSYNSLIDTSLRINGIVRYINSKFKDTDIRVGIGADFGRAFMTKVGEDEVIYAGQVINSVCELSKNACHLFNKPVIIGERLFNLIPERRAELFLKNSSENFYECDEIFHEMDI